MARIWDPVWLWNGREEIADPDSPVVFCSHRICLPVLFAENSLVWTHVPENLITPLQVMISEYIWIVSNLKFPKQKLKMKVRSLWKSLVWEHGTNKINKPIGRGHPEPMISLRGVGQAAAAIERARRDTPSPARRRPMRTPRTPPARKRRSRSRRSRSSGSVPKVVYRVYSWGVFRVFFMIFHV